METEPNDEDFDPNPPDLSPDTTISAQELNEDDPQDDEQPTLPSGAGRPRVKVEGRRGGTGRRPGRPKGSTKGRRRVVTTEYVDEEDRTSAMPDIPLMDVSNECERIDVERLGPIHEGFLGYIEPDATEEVIIDQWGGGKFHLKAKRGNGRVITRKTVKLAGDPIFESRDAQRKWERQVGGAKGNGESLSITEYMRMQDERDERTRKESQHREDERRKYEADALQRQKDAERLSEEQRRSREVEWEQQRMRQQEDIDRRRRTEEDERDVRHRKESEENDRRRQSDLERTQNTSNEFHKSMMAMVQTNSTQAMEQLRLTLNNQKRSEPSDQFEKAIGVLASAKQLFGGDDANDADPWAMFVKSLPMLLDSAGGAVGKAITEVKNPGATRAAGQPGQPPAQQGGLPPELNAKFSALATKWAGEGKDPIMMFNRVTDSLLKMKPPEGNNPPSQAGEINPGEPKMSKVNPPPEPYDAVKKDKASVVNPPQESYKPNRVTFKMGKGRTSP